jgi:four helix bundle protein
MEIIKVYDLEERTSKFAEKIIDFVGKVEKTAVNAVIIDQLLRSGMSVGANYCEADDAESRKDFKHKIGICKKEAREARYWLRMIMVSAPALKGEAMPIWQEAKELNLIFNAIRKKL